MRMRPRSGKPLGDRLDLGEVHAAVGRHHARERARLRDREPIARCASSANSGGSGLSAITTRSPPSSSFACWSSAACTRSAKNPTVVTLATAMKSASEQHAQLSRGPVPAEHSHRQRQGLHFRKLQPGTRRTQRSTEDTEKCNMCVSCLRLQAAKYKQSFAFSVFSVDLCVLRVPGFSESARQISLHG